MAAAEACRSTMGRTGRFSENQTLFPDWVNEAAYMNDTELADLALDLEEGVPATGAPARSIVAPESVHHDHRPPEPPDIPRI